MRRNDPSIASPRRGSSVAPGAVAASAALPPDYEETGDFVIGDEDDEHAEIYSQSEKAELVGEPPAYDATEAEGAAPFNEKGAAGTSSDQMQLHYLRPEDTLLGLSMKYGESGELLCRCVLIRHSTSGSDTDDRHV